MIEGLQDILKADSSRATKMDCTASVEEYINKSDWRINANANTGYSSAGLVNNLAGKAIANYWLDKVYSKKEGTTGQTHLQGQCASTLSRRWTQRRVMMTLMPTI